MTSPVGGIRDELSALLRELRETAARSLRSLDAELAGLRAARVDAVSDDEHDPDGGTLAGEWSRMQGLRRESAQELTDIERALDRLTTDDGSGDDGSGFGVCAACGRDIPLGRLRARPTATLCVECAARGRR
ncbi:MAG: TraR/DksA C4-type zinc finger protein [Micrococcales bacterium]|nr:TraR/DksA C4-type zinc finger protein [Micrococcales bacterium]